MRKALGRELWVFALLVVLCLFLAWMNPRFLTPINLQNTGRLIGMYGVFSLGLALIIVTGGIDLSVGSMIALLGVLLAIGLVDQGLPLPAVVVGVLAVGTALGAVHGWLITRLRLQPFIVTLCGLLLYRGLARFVAGDETKGFGRGEGMEALKLAATGNVLGVPVPLVLLLASALVVGVLLHRSVYGRHLLAVGRNEEAARFSGIHVNRTIAIAYVLGGLLTAVSAILFAFYTNSISPSSHGNFFELFGIAAAVLGGCSLRGGEGSVLGVLFGAALLQVLQNLVNLLGIPSSLNFAVMGAVILIGVLADSLVQRRSRVRTA